MPKYDVVVRPVDNNAFSIIGAALNALCVDAAGRRCFSGADFMRARDEGTFPVRFWFDEGGQTVKEQRKSQIATNKALKLHYPWRPAKF